LKAASISKLKASLSEYLDAVRKGEEVVITDRGQPIARLLPIESRKAGDGAWARLVREGIIAPPRKPRAQKLEPPSGRKVSGVLAALLEERAESR
jgi:prevent-host-death family protein